MLIMRSLGLYIDVELEKKKHISVHVCNNYTFGELHTLCQLTI